MDPAQALADLTEISSQVLSAAMFGADGSIVASTFADGESARRFVDAARALIDEAEAVPHESGSGRLVQLEVATVDGSLFVVRDAERAVAATTRPEPTVGLVFYDLKSCLRSASAPAGDDGKPRPRARRKAGEESAAASDESAA